MSEAIMSTERSSLRIPTPPYLRYIYAYIALSMLWLIYGHVSEIRWPDPATQEALDALPPEAPWQERYHLMAEVRLQMQLVPILIKMGLSSVAFVLLALTWWRAYHYPLLVLDEHGLTVHGLTGRPSLRLAYAEIASVGVNHGLSHLLVRTREGRTHRVFDGALTADRDRIFAYLQAQGVDLEVP